MAEKNPDSSTPSISPPGQSGPFPRTDWQRLEALRNGGDEVKKAILGEMFVRYREPILAFLGRKGCRVDRAEDLVQDFFLYSMQHQLFEKADPERGRFRNLMLKALEHFAANAHRADNAKMRRPEAGIASMDAAGIDAAVPAGADDPQRSFLRAWAEALVRRVIDALAAEYASPERRVHYEIFRRFLVSPILEGTPPPSQRALAAEFGLTEKEVANRLVTGRRAYQRLLREEVAAYARSEEEAETELREIFQQLSRS